MPVSNSKIDQLADLMSGAAPVEPKKDSFAQLADIMSNSNKIAGTSTLFGPTAQNPYEQFTEADLIAEASPSQIPGDITPEQKGLLKVTTQQNKKLLKKIDKLLDTTGISEKFPGIVPFYRDTETDIDRFLKNKFGSTMKIIEKFQIPQQALFNTLKRIQVGDTDLDSISQGIADAVRGKEGTQAITLFNKALDEMADAGFVDKLIVQGVKENPAYKAIGFAGDVLVDPLLAVGSGLTKAGRVATVAKSADELGTGIKLGSKTAQDIAAFYGSKTATEEMLKNFPRLAATKPEQIEKGQWALVTILGRPAFKGKGIIQAVGPIADKLGQSNLVKSLRAAVSTRTGNDQLDEIMFRTQQMYKLADVEAQKAGVEIGKRLQNVDKEQVNLISRILDEGLDYEIVHDPKLMGKTTQGILGVSPKVGAVVGDLRNEFQFMRDVEMSQGVLKSQFENYFPRVATKEALEKMSEEEILNLNKFNILPKGQKLKFAQGRETAEFTLDEFNKMKAANEGIEQFFTKDPAVALAIRKRGSMKALTTAEMWDDVASKLASKTGEGVEVGGVERLKGLKFDKEVAQSLKRMSEVINDPTDIRQMYGKWKEMTDWWKGWTLGVFPEYHFRNAVSNYWNNWLAGVNDPKYYYDGFKVLKGAEGTLTTSTGHKWSYEQIRQLAKKWGVEGSGWYGAEIPEEIAKRVRGESFETVPEALKTVFAHAPEGPDIISRTAQKAKAVLTPGRDNQVLKLGFAVGKGIENNARMAHFMYQLKQGATPYEAAKSVAKYLFDYSDLTRFEKNLKQFLPFMKWSKQNVPLQVTNLFKQPWKYTMVSKGRAAFFEEGEPFQAVYPESADFIRENVPIRIRTTPEGNHEYFLLGGWWPGGDLEKLLRPLDATLSLLHPALSTPLALSMKILEFQSPRAAREQSIEMNEPVEFLGVKMPRKQRTLWRTMRLATSADRFMKAIKEMELQEGEASATPILKTLQPLTGIKAYETSPARDVLYNRLQRRDILRRRLRQLSKEKETGEEQ